MATPNAACYGPGAGDDGGEDYEPPKCNPIYQNWISPHGADAAAVAKSVGTSEANILGISALESGWGSGPFVGNGRNAYFNLEKVRAKKDPNPALLPFSTGWAKASGSNALVATYGNYLDSAKSFAAVEGNIIKNVTDPTQFASNLQTLGKFGIGPNGPMKNLCPISSALSTNSTLVWVNKKMGAKVTLKACVVGAAVFLSLSATAFQRAALLERALRSDWCNRHLWRWARMDQR